MSKSNRNTEPKPGPVTPGPRQRGAGRSRVTRTKTAEHSDGAGRGLPSGGANPDSQPRVGLPRVFISYSHQDRMWLDELVCQLRVVWWSIPFEIWYDDEIKAGEVFRSRIHTAMSTAQVAVFLISAHSLSSDFIREQELPCLRRRHDAREMDLVPVLISACQWKAVRWLEALQVLPRGAVPLSTCQDKDEQLSQIARAVHDLLIRGLRPRSTSNEDLATNSPPSSRSGFSCNETEVGVEITLNIALCAFTEELQARLLNAIRAFLGEVRLIGRRPGSVKLTFAVTPAQAQQLAQAVRSGKFAEHHVTDATLDVPRMTVEVSGEPSRPAEVAPPLAVPRATSKDVKSLDYPRSTVMAQSIGQFVNELTGGRGFVFVIMPFEHASTTAVYTRFKRVVEDEFRLACLRADDVKSAGHDLLHKIHELIQRADLVVADISKREKKDFSPNVFYEVGYATAKEKPLLLLAHSQTKIPTDLAGLETIRYEDATVAALEEFDREFRKHLRGQLGSRTARLRDMLLSNDPVPSLIVAHPRYPGPNSRIQGHRYDRRTFGDNLGIVGLLSAFGSVLGEAATPELVSATYHDPRLQHESVNLYLIGSKKVNPLAGVMLARAQQAHAGEDDPTWDLGAYPPEVEEGDYKVTLQRVAHGQRVPLIGKKGPFGENGGEVHTEDFGIVVRAPHPDHANRLVTILAGGHSLGTGAACIAATRSQKVEEILAKLGDKRNQLADKTKAIWVLVKGTAGADGMLQDDGVKIVEAGVYGDANAKQ
jgi:hypothetical protein